MSAVGQIEKKTQQRVVKLFRDQLGYDYLGDWNEREDNRNVEPNLLRAWLVERGVEATLITRALHVLEKAAGNSAKSLYDRNRAVYELLRYGVKVKADHGENTQTVWLIDWAHPEKNHFAIAEEVTVTGADARASTKRPDVVIYVNGIALGVLELKRSIVSIGEGIRQNLDNQKKEFIQPFFSTMQLVMAGSDAQGLHYGTIETKESYYLNWKEDSPVENPLDRALLQLCAKPRLLELIHDFVVFDAGTKKLCRHNQYFGVRAAQGFVKRREGGILWHTQGSGKSLTMVWLAKWIRENRIDARVLIITDRTELDKQIADTFNGVNEQIYRTRSGADLIAKLNLAQPWLLCSLIHKFGGVEDGEEVGDIVAYVEEVKKALPAGFVAKGDLYVFVDECHRTQRYRLRVLHHEGRAKVVLRNSSRLELHIRPEATAGRKERVLQAWYRDQLKARIPALLAKWQPILGVKVADWGVRKMKTRWGTCNIEARRIWLNLELAQKPAQCLEYILVHELAHLVERKHNDRFLVLMNRHLPQWRLRRAKLNTAPLAHEHWSY